MITIIIQGDLEGFERRSNKEFIHCLFITIGSCGEVRLMHILAEELKKMKPLNVNELIELTVEISNLIFRSVKTLS